MTARLVFLDTETTSLRPDRRAWDIGIIVRDPGKPDMEYSWFIDAFDLDLGNADVMSLKIGRFYDRHPEYKPGAGGYMDTVSEAEAMRYVEMFTRGAHLVGAVPNFDTEVLGARMRAKGVCPSWHHHLIDIEALAIGCLTTELRLGNTEVNGALLELPWKSDDLSAMLGVTVSEEDRHTALGDAKVARAVYDTVMGHA